MCCSYIIGRPAVGLIGAFSIYWHEPLLIIIGGPLLLIISHLVFLAGMYLAGGKYVMVFFRWATRVTLEKLMWKREALQSLPLSKKNNWLTTAWRWTGDYLAAVKSSTLSSFWCFGTGLLRFAARHLCQALQITAIKTNYFRHSFFADYSNRW